MKLSNWNEYLSINNNWTKRFVGLEIFQKIRDLSQIDREYNQDKYGSLLTHNCEGIEDYKKLEMKNSGLDDSSETFISFEEEIFKTNVKLARQIYYSLIYTTLKDYKRDSNFLCELGCGYGYNLSYLSSLKLKMLGGEYCENAVNIAKKVGMDVSQFNYYNQLDYNLIKKESIVLTVHSVEQLPSAEPFIQGLYRQKEKINIIINFEPTYLQERQSFVGMLRNKYIEINDYNRDLITILRERNDVDIIKYNPDIIGLNPLNSTNLIVWKFI